jgi:hypothetical protein
VPLGYCDEMGNRDEHCRIRPHRDTVMAVWEAYRGGTELVETNGPVIPETSPFRPRPRRTPLPVTSDTDVPERPVMASSESAGAADRV